MGKVTIKHPHQSKLRRDVDDLADFGEKLIHMSSRQARLVLSHTMNLLESTMPMGRSKLFNRSCEIPETDCPPRCVCEFFWHACRGEKGQFTVRVTNTGEQTRTFTFTANPFTGPGNPETTITVTPDEATLNPGESEVLTLNHTVTDEFIPNCRYIAEVLIVGAYEQCVRIILDVEPIETGHCEVKQGEKPKRLRAHRWYHHFQCEEPCFPDRPRDKPQPEG
jgi:hypothetical protein